MKKLLFPLLILSASALALPAYATDGSTAPPSISTVVLALFGALAVGILLALLVVLPMKRAMSTVRKQKRADGYIQSGSFKLTESRDIFLYSTVTRIRINTNKRK